MITGVWLGPPDEFDGRETIAVQFDEEQLLLWVDGSTVDEVDEIPGDWEELIPANRLTDLIDQWEKEASRLEGPLAGVMLLEGNAHFRARSSQMAAAKRMRSCIAELSAAMHTNGQL